MVLVGSLVTLLTAATLAAEPESSRCLACHSPLVAEHLLDWDRSVHARAGVVCTSCHRPAPASAATPVPGTEGWSRAATTCGSCHIAVESAFRTSRHAALARAVAGGPSCADCHTRAGGNVLTPERFAAGCGRCHAERTREGELLISRRAIRVLEALRRVTLARALVGQQVDERRRVDALPHAIEQRFEDLTTIIDDLAAEWHRFDFDTVERRCGRVLDTLEKLHRELPEPR